MKILRLLLETVVLVKVIYMVLKILKQWNVFTGPRILPHVPNLNGLNSSSDSSNSWYFLAGKKELLVISSPNVTMSVRLYISKLKFNL